MSRIIPGVQITVVKDVVPPQLAPSGIFGLIGLVARSREGTTRQLVERVATWARFRELYGRGTARVMPEAQQAFQNGISELVVVDLQSTVASPAFVTLDVGGTGFLTFRARAAGTRPNGLEVALRPRGSTYELRLREASKDLEVYRNVSIIPGDASSMGNVLAANDSEIAVDVPTVVYVGPSTTLNPGGSQVIATIAAVATVQVSVQSGAPLQLVTDATGTHLSRDGVALFSIPSGDDGSALVELRDVLRAEPGLDFVVGLPEASGTLGGGVDASTTEYVEALGLLEDVADVDLVSVALQDHGDTDNDRATTIYTAVIAHCEQMSADARGRIGFGQVSAAAPAGSGTGDDDPLDVQMADLLRSERFVLLAPHGALGAAVGRIGGLAYHQSPTFKNLAGLGDFRPVLRVEEQRTYLQANVVPIVQLPGRGVSIVRGLTTDGDQINVRRIADRAVRAVRLVGESFIGKLNTEDGRNALKQKLTEILLQMQSDDAIVPSTDGSDPAFKLAVYSSQADFAQGIVRVDLAVRPVRSIDFIYATVLVQA